MNYRHAFHAGNFADVVKHVLLTRLIAYLKRKEKPFRVIDTHAGRGAYDLLSESATRTAEASEGVERILSSSADLAEDSLFADYLAVLALERSTSRYPGSPLIARRLLRERDRLSAYELHGDDALALKQLFAGDVAVKAIELDGWLALASHVPPKERRGLVLIDPPFEKMDEIEAIVGGLGKALKRWPTGTYALWYPLKRREAVERLYAGLQTLGGREAVVTEFFAEPYAVEPRLVGSGLYVINPPYTFADEARAVLRRLLPILGRGSNATFAVFEPPKAGV